ncbi:DUF4865 family protein [Tistrella mobilis]|uniref:DUF4865 domain-containing protein n=1 Tax=Tistrella mobilis (strain KA081020-065) TaxID=1110502 RepID=I3TLL8_TISMK|nr:DUF4865 family protein [Tistrella mobilis]AFK53656.1 hypothetical protein TMO_1817 [Tistrella mobilis KA081020-065]MAM73265.1 DUF4865 domain-containing protein [Tistrella sp.]
MLALQYTVRLKADVDADMIRRRVAERGSLYDNHPGLVMKSFLLNEEDQVYAPFYIWRSEEDWKQFVFGDLFANLAAAFGRPRVRTWFVLGFGHGACTDQPRFAVREVDVIAPETSLEAVREREAALQAQMLTKPGLYAHSIALDADRWELVRYSLWCNEAASRDAAVGAQSDCVNTYEVLHFSEPGGRG